jgi:hypothetical protein
MSSLRKKEPLDFRQGSPNRLELCNLHDWLLQSDLPIPTDRSAPGGITNFKKQNHRSYDAVVRPLNFLLDKHSACEHRY